jgi:hypothetical protein
MTLNYGVLGIRQRDYRVYIAFESQLTALCAELVSFFEDYDSGAYDAAYGHLQTIMASKMTHIGEMRKDSIDVSIADGDSVEGNEIGKFVMSKTGTFSCELINATPDNKNALANADSQEAIIMLVEISNNRIENFNDAGAFFELHEIVFVGNMESIINGLDSGVGGSFSYSEKDTGGTIPTSTISIEKKVPNAASFRKIIDQPYDYDEEVDAIVLHETTAWGPGGSGKLVPGWTDSMNASVTGYLVEVATSNTFDNTIVQSVEVDVGEGEVTITGLTNGIEYFVRVRAMVGRYPKSKYSNIESGTPAAP